MILFSTTGTIQFELTFGHLRYFFKGTAPHINCPPTIFLILSKYKQKLKNGISLATKQILAYLHQRLPIILYINFIYSIAGYSKAAQGLLFPRKFSGLFT